MSRSVSTALEQKRHFSNVPRTPSSISVFNDGPAQFLHVYDLAVSTVSGTPLLIIPIPADATICLDGSTISKLAFTAGILVANTTTTVTYTAGAADCWFTGTYE